MPDLAINGGTPVRPRSLPYGRQSIDEDDIAAVTDVLRSDWLTSGPKIAEFEAAVAERTEARHAIAVSNGTAALHAAMFAAHVAPGDEVIVPPLTFVATANCVRYQGGTVVFADVRADTLCIDPDAVQAAITPRTKAIIAVDYAGRPADLARLRTLAERHGLILVEDASHALGSTYHDRPIGSVSDLTTFSLHPVKHVTTGEGGVITTDSSDLAASLRTFRSHGITSDHRQREAAGSWMYEMVALGFNYRLTDFQAALGLSQLHKLSGWIARRRSIAAKYDAAFSARGDIVLPAPEQGTVSAWHLYVIRLRTELLTTSRGGIFAALRAENIGVNVHYIPVQAHPYYRQLGYDPMDTPVALDAYERMLSLPIWPGMTDNDADDVVTAVNKVLDAYRR